MENREVFGQEGVSRSGVGIGQHRVQIGRVMRPQLVVCVVRLIKLVLVSRAGTKLHGPLDHTYGQVGCEARCRNARRLVGHHWRSPHASDRRR